MALHQVASRLTGITWLFFVSMALPLLGQEEGEVVGIPWTGQAGITQTVAQIMARDKNLPIQSSMQPAQSDEGRLLPNRLNLTGNPPSPHVAQWPPGKKSTATAPSDPAPIINAQSVGTSFLAAQLSESGYIPPDSMGDVGPSQVLVCVNGRIKVFDKNGVLGALNATTKGFFSSLNINSPSDPRVRYDRLSGRWFVTIIDVPHSKKDNKILIAVSSGSVITGSSSFTFFSFAHSSPSGGGDSGFFADYPTLGIDQNALYIGANIFSGNSYVGTSAYVVQKANLLAGGLTVTAFRQLASSSGPGPSTPQGVDNDDPTATQGFFIGIDNVSQGLLVIRRVSNPGGVPSISGNLNLTVPTTTPPSVGGVPALGSSVGLDALDDRLFVARMHKGSLWTAHNLEVDSTGTANAGGGRIGSRWYEITNLTATPGLRQSGTLFDPAPSNPANYWIPSCVMNGQGHMVMGCSVAGVNENAEVAVSARYASDLLGTLQSPSVVQSSSSAYNLADNSTPHRWGDYSLTSVDPNDDMTFWTVQEYCNANNSWGVRVIQLKAPPPAVPITCNPAFLPAGAVNIDVVITGLATNGSGFFDPGPAFPNHLSAAINGGAVTVNSVTYTDPAHLTVNVTVGAAAANGGRTVSITNPDGQTSLSSSAIFSIIGGSTNQPPVISNIAAQTINEDAPLIGLAVVVGDTETPVGNLILAASSSNTNLVPAFNISFAGSGSNRTVQIIPVANQNGVTTITLTVTDLDGSSSTTSFLLTVTPVNDPPSFLKGLDQTVLENAGPQNVPNWASAISLGPANESSQNLDFIVTNDHPSLFSIQPSITPDGSLSYTAAPNSNGVAMVTVRLHDDGGTDNGGADTSPPQTFTITVTPVNDPPVLGVIPDQIIDEGSLLVITNMATDIDSPLNALTFSLLEAPSGAAIDTATGRLTWTPSEEQGPGTHPVKVVVSDNGSPSLSATQSFMVVVREVNVAPQLSPIANQVFYQGSTLILTNQATDADLPPNQLTYSLSNAPAGAMIDSASGLFTWTPGPDQTNLTNSISVIVTDNGSPALSDTKTFTVAVLPPPRISSVQLTNGAVTLTWNAIPGTTYRVQFKNDLDGSSNWQNLHEPVTANDITATKTDTDVSAPQRFYRVMVGDSP